MSKRFLKYETEETNGLIDDNGVLKQSQPDYNQNDETASDYIKNRPFYSEVLVDEYIDNYSGMSSYELKYSSPISIIAGERYTVYLNGVVYTTATASSGNSLTAPDGAVIGIYSISSLKLTDASYHVKIVHHAKELDSNFIVLTSPNGTKYNLSVDDSGNLSAVAQS